MDTKRFDDLTRGIAQGVSRRDVLKLFFAAIASIGASSILKLDGDELSIGTQTAAAKVACQDTNDVFIPCWQVDEYVQTCGVICPNANGLRVPGAGGCTFSRPSNDHNASISDWTYHHEKGLQWSVEASAAWVWGWDQYPEYDYINLVPSDRPCCSDACHNEIQAVTDELIAHEQGHVNNAVNAFNKVNDEWRKRKFTGYGKTKQRARADLETKVFLAQEEARQYYFIEATKEPLPETRPLDCSLCNEAAAGEICCNDGRCRPENLCEPCATPCPDCHTCNHETGACEPVDCGDPCLVCQNNSCQPKCVGCMHCENGRCLSNCGENENCCGDQCYNGSQGTCCGPENARYLCPPNYECCAGSRICCDTRLSRCCGGACVAYGRDNCGDCRQCNDGQVCCIGDQGQIYGCDDEDNCPR